jgi:hypothetical protein
MHFNEEFLTDVYSRIHAILELSISELQLTEIVSFENKAR